jgi:hypothetical protein
MTWKTESNWRWCEKCQGLWFGGNGAAPCPGGGKHIKTESDNYSLVHGTKEARGESNWRWCSKCQGLWFAGNAVGACPAGGDHIQVGSEDYTIATDVTGGGQPGWRRCSKCQGMWYGLVDKEVGRCPAGKGHSKDGSIGYQPVRVTQRIRVHAKIVSPPHISIEIMMQRMREIFAFAELDVDWATTENLDLEGLKDLDVGECDKSTTEEQDELYNNRKDVVTNEIAVYFVSSTLPPYFGCACHPAGKPSVAVAQTATQWTLAHEVGHVLGLSHVVNTDQLMTKSGTNNITCPPPDLDESEKKTMTGSKYTRNI